MTAQRNARSHRIGRLLVLVGLVGLSHCYRPTYEGPYSCSPARASEDCPAGWQCQNGLCQDPSTPAPDTGACVGPGTLLTMSSGAEVWACEGSFPSGTYRSLCQSRASVHVCGEKRSDDALLAVLSCDSLRGFFLSSYSLALGGPPPGPVCDAVPGPSQALLGCGMADNIARLGGPTCHGLRHVLSCTSPSTGWSCDRTRALASVAHTATASSPGGVLCCEDVGP